MVEHPPTGCSTALAEAADAARTLGHVPAWKPAFLVHGDDHGRIGERKASLRRMAEAEAGAGGVELLEGDAATPEAVAWELSAMTIAIGRRFVIVEGVERWKDADVKQHLEPVLEVLRDQETTVAFFGRDEGRAKTPPALAKAVEKAGGIVGVEATVKGRELPRWLIAEARKLDVQLDAGGARELIAAVGERQQRLLRELETLAIEHGTGAKIGEEEVAAVAARSAERQVWGLVDALVARDGHGALRAYLGLRDQGEAIARLLPLMARRLREVLAVAVRLERGEGVAQIKDALKLPPWMADRRVSEARGTDADALRRALEALARLEETSRGLGDASEDTAAIRAIEAIAA